MRVKSMTAALCAVAIAACAPSGPAPVDVFSLSSVPQEGGTRFTMITSNDDVALGPNVAESPTGGLILPTSNYFDVSPNGKSVVFLAERNGSRNIFLKSTEGGVASTQRTFRDVVFDPAFSSDGQRLAFVDVRNSRTNVFEIGATQGAAIRQITNFEQASDQPAYSPAGGKLVFVQHERTATALTPVDARGGRGSKPADAGAAATNRTATRNYIWEVDLDKNSFTQLAEGSTPAFSPDGKKLAVSRNSRDTGASEIWIIDLASGTETLVATSKNQGYLQPAFSPDGKQLAFTVSTLGTKGVQSNFDIFLTNVDGSGLTQLTFHPGHDIAPRFAPDGKSIYFISERGNSTRKWNVWRMDVSR